MPKLGFIGIGLMGQPMVLRLLEAGCSVRVWNRSPEKLQQVIEKGAQQAESIAELTKQADIVMLCVTDTSVVEEVVFSQEGVASAGSEQQQLIDFSSIDPAATRSFADRLYNQCKMEWVDAPVSGGVAGAEAGSLAIMAGGKSEVVDTLRPVLAPLSSRVTYMGPVGSGQVTKVCNQMLVCCNVMAMAEVIALAENNGVDATQLPEALKGGFADSIPLQLTGSRMASSDFDEVKWHVKTLLKDLKLAKNLADNDRSSVPMSMLADQLMQVHGNQGNMEKDPCTLVELYREKNEK